MPLSLSLIRHGETAWNAEHRFQGQSDVPLNKRGNRQVQALQKRFSQENLSALYTSDLQRAWETAELIASPHHSLSPIPEPRFRELSFGDWEGLTYQEIEDQAPDLLDLWQKDLWSTHPPGGETLQDLSKRVLAGYEEITSCHTEGHILIVAHGGSLQILLCHLLGLAPKNYWQLHLSTGSISRVALYEEGAILNALNDTCHLRDLKPSAPKST